jgi:hypothetical protein
VRHRLKRLENCKAALEPHFQAALRREAQAQWAVDTSDIRARIAALSKELVDVYPRAVATLVDLFGRVESLNREAAQFRGAAPAGCGLGSVEGAERIRDVILPRLGSSKDAKPDWPPKPVNVALEYALSVERMIRGAPPPPTEAERIAESARVIAHAQEQERGRLRLNEQAEARARGLAG